MTSHYGMMNMTQSTQAMTANVATPHADTFEVTHRPQGAILACVDLTKQYNEGPHPLMVLDRVSINFYSGQLVAIVGASGVGKSTLLHVLGGLDQPTQGDVQLMGQTLTTCTETTRCALRNQHLGFVYQFHHLLAEFNALENVAMPLLIRGVSRAEARERASAMIAQVGLTHRLTYRVTDLSGGERQRIAIARALVTEPNCVLADEPTGNLDVNTAQQVFDLMLALNERLNTAFIMVTHNLALAQHMAQVYILENGQLRLSSGDDLAYPPSSLR